MNATRILVSSAFVCAGLAARASSASADTLQVTGPIPVLIVPLAHMLTMPAPPPPHLIPSHLAIGNRVFDASVSGLRAYIESIKATEPQLYAQLAPDVERLESKQEASLAVLGIGLTAAVASTIYAFAGRSTCQEPSINDPNFSAKAAAWGSCNQQNADMTAEFLLVGVVAATAGIFGAFAVAPHRSDLLQVLDKNNRQSPEPLRLQLGYDPGRKRAFAGAVLTF
jgi:hypothetical protein